MSKPTWGEVLDRYEAALVRQREALDGDAAGFEAFAPPADLGPLPEALRPRAIALLGATRVLESRAAAMLAAAARERDVVRASRVGPVDSAARFVDRRL